MDVGTPSSRNYIDEQRRVDSGEREFVNVHRIRAILQRRRRLLIGVALVVFGVIALITLQLKPKYTATAELMLNQRPTKIVVGQNSDPNTPPDSSAVDTEVQVLTSHALAGQVADALHLQADPEFNAVLRPPSLAQKLGLSNILHRPKSESVTAPSQAEVRDHIADALLGRLKVARQGATYVINASFTSGSAAKAMQIINAFADAYLNDQLEAKFDSTKHANDWLNDHLDGLRSQAESADAAVQAYKSANGLLSSEGNTLTEQSISGLSSEIAAARAAQAEAEARLATAKSQLAHGSTGEDVGEALSSQVIQQLRAQRAEVSRQVADMSGRYGSKHPDLLKAQRQLEDIDSQISAEIKRIIASLEAQAQVARQRTASLQGSLSNSRGMLAANNSASVKLNELQRNADSVKTLYQSYLDRFKETSAEQGIEQTDARILSRAHLPTQPSSPNVKINLLLGVILGLAAGIAAVMVAEAFDQGLSSAEDVENELGVPALVAVPLLSSIVDNKSSARHLSPADFVAEKPMSRFAEAFRTLKTSLVYASFDKKVQIVAVCSSVPGEGKTTTTVALARSTALSGTSSCIVDCDLRRRSVQRVFGFEPKVGLLEVMNGSATLEQALVRDNISGAYVLALAEAPYSPQEVFGSEAIDKVLEKLRGRFEMVFLDTAPILAVADTAVLAGKADAVLFLTLWHRTSARLVRNSLKALAMVNAKVAGVSLTQVDVREQSRAGYGEAVYYSKKHGDYYSEA